MAKLIKIIIFTSLVCLISNEADGQEYSGFYMNYPIPEESTINVPGDYTPFYISHYGRHGSRWISEKIIYDRTAILLEKADRQDALTEKGHQLYNSIKSIIDDSKGMEGELSPQGVREHRGIAERMYHNWPEVFKQNARIDSRATQYSRCILSMAAFDERLKEMEPSLQISRKASRRDLTYMSYYGFTEGSWRKSLEASDSLAQAWIEPQRFLHSLFSSQKFIERIDRPYLAMADIFHLACSQQATGGQDDLYGYFTEDELDMLGKVLSTQTYIEEGPSTRFGDGNMANARNLLRNIVVTADKVISGDLDEAASLRFGHESNIVPLLCLTRAGKADIMEKRSNACGWPAELEMAAQEWKISQICPMATNLQLVFFKTPDEGIKVLVLHNERKVQLPLEGAPFYDWTILRDYLYGLCQ